MVASLVGSQESGVGSLFRVNKVRMRYERVLLTHDSWLLTFH